MSDKDLRISVRQLQAALINDPNCFKKYFFENLSIGCSNPRRMYDVFQSFIYTTFSDSLQIDKCAAMEIIFNSVYKSKFLLDSLLSALYWWNLSTPNQFTQFSKYLNEDLTKKDWSRLKTPTIVKIRDQLDPKAGSSTSHPIDLCIYEIVFSHTPTIELANSQFTDIPIDSYSTLDLLSDESLNNFADALIIHFIDQPKEIFRRLKKKNQNTFEIENKLAISIFRSRNIGDINQFSDKQILNDNKFQLLVDNSDLNLDTIVYLKLKRTLTFNSNENNQYSVQKLNRKIKNIYSQLNIERTNNNLFPFFSILVLPNADILDDTFIQTVINCPIFPSSNPNFPDHLFKSSEKCQRFITIKVLFDIFKKSGTEDLEDFEKSFDDAYQNIIAPHGIEAEEYRIETVLESIFSSYVTKENKPDSNLEESELEKIEKANSFVKHVFLWFITNKEDITPSLIHRCIASFINQYYEAVCELTLCAINEVTKIELFLNSHTLSAFFDQIFANMYKNYNKFNSNSANENDLNLVSIDPALALSVLYQITMKYYEESEVFNFWNENFSIIIDSISSSHPLTNELLQFLNDFLKNANEEFLSQILSTFVDDYEEQDNYNGDKAMQLVGKLMHID